MFNCNYYYFFKYNSAIDLFYINVLYYSQYIFF